MIHQYIDIIHTIHNSIIVSSTARIIIQCSTTDGGSTAACIAQISSSVFVRRDEYWLVDAFVY